MDEKKLTGYPSIDKPWLKYYPQKAINAPMPGASIYEYIFENNKAYPQNIALVYYGNKITYGTLFHNINKAANAFRTIGVKPGDVVSFMSITTPELVYGIYALNKIGAIANMLDPRASEKTLITQLSRAESKILVVLDACADKVEMLSKQAKLDHIIQISVKASMGFPIKQIYSLKTSMDRKSIKYTGFKMVGWTDFLATGSGHNDENNIGLADTPALIWYTGGTTGDPKGVLLSNLNINSVAEQYKNTDAGIARKQTWLTISAPFIAYAFICGLHLPLSYGMQCHIELYDPESMAKSIVKNRYQHVAVTPIVWEHTIKLPQSQKMDFSFLIAPTSGGDALNPKLERDLNAFLESHNCEWKICQGYGMTEVGSGVSMSITNDCFKPGSVGVPFANTLISTFDVDTGKELPIGEIGEVCVCGPSVMLGYYKNPEATDAMIRVHEDGTKWLHTGDLGHIDEDGNLFITGRIKRIIIRYDSFKVFPSAVEEKLLEHPAVEKCSVVGQKDPRGEGGQLPVAFLVLNMEYTSQREKHLQEVIAHSQKVLPEYAQPVQFFVKDSLPLTPAGKIDYRTLAKEAENR